MCKPCTDNTCVLLLASPNFFAECECRGLAALQRGDMVEQIQCGAQCRACVEFVDDVAFAGFDGCGGGQEGRDAVGVDDDDAFVVGEDHVARLDDDAAAGDGDLEFAEFGGGAGEWGDEAAVDREWAARHVADVTVAAVHDDAAESADEGAACEQFAAQGDLPCAAVDDDDVAWGRGLDRAQHTEEVVLAPDGERGSEDARCGGPGLDRAVQYACRLVRVADRGGVDRAEAFGKVIRWHGAEDTRAMAPFSGPPVPPRSVRRLPCRRTGTS